MERKAAVEEAVLLCVAVKEVASMPLSAELSCRKPLSSRSLRTAEREPTSYHLSSLWAELEALLERVLLLDWLDEYGASWWGGGGEGVGVRSASARARRTVTRKRVSP